MQRLYIIYSPFHFGLFPGSFRVSVRRNRFFRFKKRWGEGRKFISPVVYCRSDRLIQVYFICFVLVFSYTKEHFCICLLVFTSFFHRFWSTIPLELLPHQQRQQPQPQLQQQQSHYTIIAVPLKPKTLGLWIYF